MHTVVRRSRKHNLLAVMAMLVLLTVSLSGILLWRVQSVQLMSVESTSMSPAIKRGDALILRATPPSKLKVGDVVSYRSSANQAVIITHRIVRLEPTWKLIITRADSASRDDQPVAESQVVGRMSTRLDHMGYVVDFLRTPQGLAASVYLPALLIIILEFQRLTRAYQKPTYRLSGYVITK
jgi:signal peptidase I